MSETTVTVDGHMFVKGDRIVINGAEFVIVSATGTTLTIRNSRWWEWLAYRLKRIYYRLRHWWLLPEEE